jgi:hypothetical protein
MGQLLVIALRIATNFIEKKLVAPHSLAQFGLRRSYLLNGSCAARSANCQLQPTGIGT